MSRGWLLLVALAGCGRLDYDPVSISGPAVDAADPLEQGQIFRFTFDDDPLVDTTGRYTAACESCPTPALGISGSAVEFNGEQCLFIPDDLGLRPSQFTFAAWALPTAVPETGEIYGRALNGATTNNNTRELFVRPTTKWNGGINGQTFIATDPLSLGQWHHLAGSYDGNDLTVYLDGQPVDTMTAGAAQYTDQDDTIGCDFDNGAINSLFVGTIDEVRLYDRPLSPDEIAALAQ